MSSFLSPVNEKRMDNLVYQDFQRRIGGDLNDKQKQRLVKTVRHYMVQVDQAMSDDSYSIQEKNAELIRAVVPDYTSYLNRSSLSQDLTQEDGSRQDIGTRFSQVQNERNQVKAKPPAPPDFRLSIEDSGPSAISIFEQMKKVREEETRRGEALIAESVRAETSFQMSRVQSEEADQMQLVERDRVKTSYQRDSANEMATRMVPPDPRRIFMKDVLDGNPSGQQGTPLEKLIGRSGLANTNATIALPSVQRTTPVLSQETLIKQEDILAYKENEYNLFVYSGDRNWYSNNKQNRYNFTVNFDPADNGTTATFSPTAAIKFKNITRIELVKTTLPIEGVDILQKCTAFKQFDTSLNTNILSFPYLNIRVPEIDNNNYGTDFNLQQAFGVVQYDANWVSDNNMVSKGGYLSMIPKFLKCQKVYQPTPLATLQKMSIRIERPDGTLVSDELDTLDIVGFTSSYDLSGNGDITGTNYGDMSGNYLWINTNEWFSRFMVNQGDRIQMQGVKFPDSFSGSSAAATDLVNFLTRTAGHLVVGIAYNKSSAFIDGPNNVGYANYIIIRSKMNDPKTGSIAPSTFGLLGNTDNNTFLSSLYSTEISGRLLNVSHQTTLVFRVITRDLDSTTRIRSDNM